MLGPTATCAFNVISRRRPRNLFRKDDFGVIKQAPYVQAFDLYVSLSFSNATAAPRSLVFHYAATGPSSTEHRQQQQQQTPLPPPPAPFTAATAITTTCTHLFPTYALPFSPLPHPGINHRPSLPPSIIPQKTKTYHRRPSAPNFLSQALLANPTL